MDKEKKRIIMGTLNQVIPFNNFLQMELVDLEDGYAKLHIPFREEFIGNPVARALHGGLIATAMDSVGGSAAVTTLVSFEDKVSTIDLRIDYLRPGKDQDLIVEGEIVRSGNRIVVTKMIAYHDNRDELIAEGKGVYNVKRKKD